MQCDANRKGEYMLFQKDVSTLIHADQQATMRISIFVSIFIFMSISIFIDEQQ